MVVSQVLLAGQLLEVPEPRRPRRFGPSGLHVRDRLCDLPVGKNILAPAARVSVGDRHAVFQFPLFPGAAVGTAMLGLTRRLFGGGLMAECHAFWQTS